MSHILQIASKWAKAEELASVAFTGRLDADLHFKDPVTLRYPRSVCCTSGQNSADVLKRSVQFPVDAPKLPSFADLTANIETVAGLRLDDPHYPRTRRYRCCVLARGRTDDWTVVAGRRGVSRPNFIVSDIRHLLLLRALKSPSPLFAVGDFQQNSKQHLSSVPSVTLAPNRPTLLARTRPSVTSRVTATTRDQTEASVCRVLLSCSSRRI